VIFTAYFDESNTHGPAPQIVMAAFLGSARQWEMFERRLKNLQAKYCFKVFHAKDFKARSREFHGWSDDKAGSLILELAVLIRDELADGLTITLSREQYESEYRAPPTPKGMSLDSQYGLCFRVCLHQLIRHITADKKKHLLHIVIENGHSNVGDCKRIFNEIKAEYKELGFDFLGTITIASKEDSAPLMVADFQAHASSIVERRKKAGLPSYVEMVHAGPPEKGEAGLTNIEFPLGSARSMKNQWEQDKQRRMATWRAARDARKISESRGQST
jgi:hypothetical protein